MAFQLKPRESVGDGIRRSVRREIEKVLEYLSAKQRPHHYGPAEAEAVHETRKCFKRARAALRLVREDLGEDTYHEENFCFRDAARPLTEVRDAEVLVETLDKLVQQTANQSDSAALATVRTALLAKRQEVVRRVLDEDHAFAKVENVATRALARTADLQIDRDGWEAMGGGLRRVYRAGQRALRLASESPSVANLHEWRKQAKYLWHLLQLLEPAWISREKNLGKRIHELSQLLGDDHDLAVLRQTLAVDPLAYGGHRILRDLFGIIDLKREEYQQQAFALGRPLYRDPPEIFTARIETDWKTLIAETGSSTASVSLPARPHNRGRSTVPLSSAKRSSPE
jgi:CHAD domain-containing protein